MQTNKISILYTTVANESDAKKLANIALSKKTATCVNIINSGISMYLWKGKIEESHECYLIFKTSTKLLSKLEELILKNHTYELPAILKFEANTTSNFLDYINNK